MNRQLKLLAVLAHPDDESLGFGGTLAKYAAEAVETYLVTATRGERGGSAHSERGRSDRSRPRSGSRNCEPPPRCSEFARSPS